MFKELKVDDWKDEIADGLEYRRLYGLEDSWASNEALFYNVHKSNAHEGPNIISSTGDSLLATLTVPSPAVLVRAESKGSLEGARLVESVDNMLIRNLGIANEVEDACLHAYLWGVGILKIGYDSEWGWDEEYDSWTDREQQMGMTMTQFDKKGNRIEFDTRIKSGMPWVKACLPHDIVVPYGTRRIEDAPWIAHRIVRHIEDLKADRKYSNVRDIEPAMSMEDYTRSYLTTMKRYRAGDTIGTGAAETTKSGRAEFVEIFEIHDKRTGKVIVISTGHDKFIRKDKDALQVAGLPFVALSLVPKARSFWTTPDAHYLTQAQSELADVSRQATKQRRLAMLKFMYAEDALEEGQMDRFLSQDVGAGVKVKSGHPLKDAIHAFTPSTGNLMLYQDADYIRRGAREAVGFSRNQMGEYEQKGRRTATEAAQVQQGSDLRINRRAKQVKDLYITMMGKINKIIFSLWTTARWVEVVGEDGAKTWEAVTGKSLKGDYSYEIEFTNKQTRDFGTRKMEALQILQTLGSMPGVDPEALKKYVESAFNDPELKGVFNAPIPTQVPGMSGGSGGASPNKQLGSAPILPSVSQGNAARGNVS